MPEVVVPDVAIFDESSREVRLLVERDGTIAWCDARAAAHGFRVGDALAALAVEGTVDKVHALVRRALEQPVVGWELAFVLDGKPTTVMCCTRTHGARLAVLGSLVPQDYADAVGEASRAMHEIVGLNRELARQKTRLEESNQAIRALHAELEQHADRLRASAEIKSRLVAGVSHEFRTPLHSILGLSKLLLGEGDGPLTEEQHTQVAFIRSSAEELSAMINDMLDLSKLDAGNAPARTQPFELRDFLSAMRGTMRPLLAPDAPVELVFDPAPDVALDTDQAKLAQIVRNLIANALKFTERGTVRVTATVHDDELRLAVRDTGIGIAAADRARIFEEFVQIDSPLQRERRGTGLGLPLAQKLAHLLGGRIAVDSVPGAGSTFTVAIPIEHAEVREFRGIQLAPPDPTRAPVLVVEDDRSAVFVYERYLAMAGFQVVPARTTRDARELLRTTLPSAILLDVMLEGEDTWAFLAEIKRDPRTHDIPVLVCTVMNREAHARALGADEFWLKPVDEDKLIRKLRTIAGSGGRGARVLVVDDDPTARYLIRKHLADTAFELIEASDGPSGIQLARDGRPDVILLDFLLQEMTAFDVLDQLKADPRTRSIPVILVTSHQLSPEDITRLGAHTQTILSKEHLSRELAIHRIRDALRHAGVRDPARKS